MAAMMQRSAALGADPKAKEIQHFVCSHGHQGRLKNAAGITTEVVEQPMTMEQQVNLLRRITAEEDNEEQYVPVGDCAARFLWREEMDRNLKRLMQDTEFALDDRLSALDKARLRCSQLDKTYEWFEKHGKKEASKERKGPAYLRFDQGERVMPGSLRGSSKFAGSVLPALRPRPNRNNSPDRRSAFHAAASQTIHAFHLPAVGSPRSPRTAHSQPPAARPFEYPPARDLGKWMP